VLCLGCPPAVAAKECDSLSGCLSLVEAVGLYKRPFALFISPGCMVGLAKEDHLV
jgi:hypothetical protein